MKPLIVDDDVFCTESPTNGMKFYDFQRFQEVHKLIADTGQKHGLAICAAEIPNHIELLDYILERKDEFVFGLHGWNHEHYSEWHKQEIVQSFSRAKERIEKVFDTKVEWYFPTWNKRSEAMYSACEDLDLKLNDNWMNLDEYLKGENKTAIRFHSWNENERMLLKIALEKMKNENQTD